MRTTPFSRIFPRSAQRAKEGHGVHGDDLVIKAGEAALERALNAETVITDTGTVHIEVHREREGSFAGSVRISVCEANWMLAEA